MSRFSGKQDFSGRKSGRPNKGVMAALRRLKREQAEERNGRTPAHKRASYRRAAWASLEQA